MNSLDMPVPENAPDAVFVHSSFRTSSTWFWTKFRAVPGCLAYNEYFNEMLATMDVVRAQTHHGADWRSNHPPTAPYFREFVPLIRPEGGVRAYNPQMSMERFVPAAGAGGDITPGERHYVATLICEAWRQGKRPVLTCTRTLARLPALKRDFGGQHLFLYRNLFHQWVSYSGQHRSGNRYFIDATLKVLRHAGEDPFIGSLYGRMVAEHGEQWRRWRRTAGDGGLFLVFAALHLYLSMLAMRAADLTIDATQLGLPDRAYQREIEARIQALTGIGVDLSDARNALDHPRELGGDLAPLRATLEPRFEEACAALDADVATVAFGRRLMEEMWDEAARFGFYTVHAD